MNGDPDTCIVRTSELPCLPRVSPCPVQLITKKYFFDSFTLIPQVLQNCCSNEILWIIFSLVVMSKTVSSNNTNKWSHDKQPIRIAVFLEKFNHIIDEQDKEQTRHGASLTHPDCDCNKRRTSNALRHLIHGNERREHYRPSTNALQNFE